MKNQFGQFNLKEQTINALTKIGFIKPTTVQQKLLPAVLSRKDVAGQSQTGSGKTHVFIIPIFNNLDFNDHKVQAVITAPSRELADQLYKVATQFAKALEIDVKIGNYVGGTDKQRSIKRLENSQPQIVIGTPGRVLDLYKSGHLDIQTASILVIDEADMTLDMGFLNEIDAIASALPKDLQMLVFSATLPQKLQPFLRKYMNNPLIEEIPTENVIADTIDNWLVASKSKEKNEVIYSLIERGGTYLTIIFANTKDRAKEIANYLRAQGISLAEIHGDIPPRERKRVMKRIQNDEFQYVVATDLAARGIDIPGVSEIINDDIPSDLEFFIHRVGRTGRNGMKGTAITLYGPDDEDKIESLEQIGVEFTPKRFKSGQLVDEKDRRARTQRKATTQKLDPTLIGLVKKKKRVIKPGYKKQIKSAIKKKNAMDKRVEQRESRKAAKRASKMRNKKKTDN